jgi:hypothetical protein
MAGLGIRVGALPTMEKRGERYRVNSKGKDFYIDLAPDTINHLEGLRRLFTAFCKAIKAYFPPFPYCYTFDKLILSKTVKQPIIRQ